jgi:glycine/sarcosine N-methyltransferase
MTDSVLDFYDQLTSDYHLLFADWKHSVRWQSELLDTLIRAELGDLPHTVLDCTCGIGTQAIGLALRGYRVHGTDLSPQAIERAIREARAFGVPVSFSIADVRALPTQLEGTFDVVLSCDNALPHLLQDDDLQRAAGSMAAKLRPGGLFLASIRDYDALVCERSPSTLPRVFDEAGQRRIVFQVWDWAADGRTYQVHQFILQSDGAAWHTAHYTTAYRALLRHEFSTILARSGFTNIRWLMPPESGYYQPVVTARIEDRGSRIEDRGSRIEDRGSRIEDGKSAVGARFPVS